MPRSRTPFAARSGIGRSEPLTAQRAVNLYAEQAPPDAKSKVVLHGTPGLAQFVGLTGGNIRGACIRGGLIYALAGDKLNEVEADGTSTTIAGTVPGTDKVKMVPGRDNIAILLDNGDLYAYDGSSVSKVTDPDLFTAQDIAYQDGFLIVWEKDSDQWQVSNLFDFGTFDALDFATAESLGDKNVAGISDRSELWIMNARTTEIWYNSGGDFPFARRDVIQRGCIARDSVVNFDNSLIWMGDDKVIYRASGYTPQRISDHSVEYAIGQDASPSEARAFQYTQEGHKFYVLQLTGSTWVFDASTQLWHERQSYQDKPWRVDGTVEAFGKVYAWDDNAAKLYTLDLDAYTEDGETIRRTVQPPPIHANRRRMFFSRFESEMEVGVGLTSGQGSDPQAMLRYSDDGGKTWSNQRFRDIGEIGEYRQRVFWHRLGSSRQRTFQMVVSDPVKIAIYSMVVDYEVEQA